MSKIYYVYVHKNPKTGSVFYIGKGKNNRAFDAKNRNRHWLHYVKKHGFVSEIVSGNMSEQCALTLEKILIGIAGLKNLCNIADGGIGNSGWSHSKNARQKISDFQRSKTPHPASIAALMLHRNQEFTEETRKKMSNAKKGIPRGPMLRHVREKISQSHMGIRPSDESREKMRKAKIGKRKREENNKFDSTLRIFQHDAHGEFIGCSYDLRTKYGIGPACVRAIITGKQKTAKGWSYKGEYNGHEINN